MCGFVILFSPNCPINRQDVRQVEHAASMIKYRGPDETRSYEDSSLVGYFNRLIITGNMSRGKQPVIFGDDRFVLFYNGEIYNLDELCHTLGNSSAIADPVSDTELIWQLYLSFGLGFVERLRGMFAIVIYDRILRKLTLVRDHLGIKPLYVANGTNGQFLVASDEKALLTFPYISSAFDASYVQRYLELGILDDSNKTLFKAISRFPAGTITEFSPNHPSRSIKYWNFKSSDSTLDQLEFDRTLLSVAKEHYNCLHPIAFFMSGGVDSSGLAGMFRFLNPVKDLETFTVFPHPNPLEEERLRTAVDYLGAANYKYIPPQEDIERNFDLFLEAQAAPVGSSNAYFQYLLTKTIAQAGFRVNIVGEGADEVFSGYARFIFPYLASLREDPARLSREIKLFKDFSGKEYHELMLGFRSFLKHGRVLDRDSPSLAAQVFYDGGIQNGGTGPSAFYDSLSDSERLCLKSYLCHHLTVKDLPYVLRMVDKNSMAFGIESRVPLIDIRLVELVMSVTSKEFMRDGWNKAILRRSLDRILPHSVVRSRVKFPRPGNDFNFVFESFRSRILHIIFESKYLINNLSTKLDKSRIQKAFERKDPNDAQLFYRLYNIAILDRIFHS